MNKLLAAACIAAVSGCAAPARVALSPDLVPIEAPGEYRHEPSHLLFPADYGAFHRVSLYRRGDDNHIVAGYAGGPPRCLSAVTFFVDPVVPGESADTAFARARGETLKAHPAAVVESEVLDPESPWKRAIYVDGDRRVELGLRRMGKIDVVDRAVYPARCVDEMRASLAEFLPWQR